MGGGGFDDLAHASAADTQQLRDPCLLPSRRDHLPDLEISQREDVRSVPIVRDEIGLETHKFTLVKRYIVCWSSHENASA